MGKHRRVRRRRQQRTGNQEAGVPESKSRKRRERTTSSKAADPQVRTEKGPLDSAMQRALVTLRVTVLVTGW